ncbi:hypothetical protein JQC91_14770 [Jannaschia sp. Os4]|uniref:hypothetical protein n=1 Tax=Jannaschia sp. Os4 TaxID=2807617 RepID=UPI0019395934|nr:hypothetical protein [Jannaschia sp. Os4]MBM2577567.1 hypothetical protein [Jannaschia sp. Os4]
MTPIPFRQTPEMSGPMPPDRPAFDAAEVRAVVERAATDPDGAYLGIASIPRRVHALRATLASLQGQATHAFVYLNGYDAVPDFLEDPRITVFRSQEFGDLNATGKVFALGHVPHGTLLTADDDFIYPANYVATLEAAIARYGGRVAACVHGSIFPDRVEHYYLRTAIFAAQQALPQDRFVTLPGTASLAVRAGVLPLELDAFLPETMVDLTLAILCKANRVPVVAVARRAHWLQNIDRDGLYQMFTRARTHHAAYAERHGPWGFDAYRDAIRSLPADRADPQVDAAAFACAAAGTVPAHWRESATYYLLKAEQARAADGARAV